MFKRHEDQPKEGEYWMLYFKDSLNPYLGVVVKDNDLYFETRDSWWDLNSEYILAALRLDTGKDISLDAKPGDTWFVCMKDSPDRYVQVRIYTLYSNKTRAFLGGSRHTRMLEFKDIDSAYRVQRPVWKLIDNKENEMNPKETLVRFINESGFYLAAELDEVDCARKSFSYVGACKKEHPHVEILYGVPEEIADEFLNKIGYTVNE